MSNPAKQTGPKIHMYILVLCIAEEKQISKTVVFCPVQISRDPRCETATARALTNLQACSSEFPPEPSEEKTAIDSSLN